MLIFVFFSTLFQTADEVLNGVAWSERLDEQFRKNYDRDPTLTWQYFGSATGFFRNYPGIYHFITYNRIFFIDKADTYASIYINMHT